MREIERIEEQLRRAYEETPWYGPSLRAVLEGVTARRAAARPLTGAHNIWEIVHHLAAWNSVITHRVTTRTRLDTPREGDWPPVNDTSEEAWQAALEWLESGYRELHAAVVSLDDSLLDGLAVEGGENTLYTTLHGAIQHNIYHAGQIAVLKKAV